MARSNMKAEAYIKTSDGRELLWYTIDESGNVVWHLPEQEAAKYKRQMMKNAGENMSAYLNTHRDAAMWGRTN